MLSNISEEDQRVFQEICDDLATALAMVRRYNEILQMLSAPDPNVLKAKELLEKYKIDTSNVQSKGGMVIHEGHDISSSVDAFKPPKLSWSARTRLRIKGLFKRER